MPSSTTLCVDCHTNASDVEIRNRRLCHDCFRKYASSKVLKRMETYRFQKNQVGNPEKRLLLPLSGGLSSLVFLQILDAQIKKQLLQQNRTAYDLVICHVSPFSYETQSSIDETRQIQWWNTVQHSFGLHTYLPVISSHDVLDHDLRFEDDLQLLELNRQDGEGNAMYLERIFGSIRTATARSDLYTILLKRLLIGIARRNDCEAILWGHSDSALAAMALSSVAKGRGGVVSTELADGMSPWGVGYNYPLRDLYRTELNLYLQSSDESLKGCLLESVDESGEGKKRQEVTVSLRLMSIDQLLGNYIEGQGEKYPGIMANVVRTAGKLQVENVDESRRCRVCSAAIDGQDIGELLCYGCKRMKQDIRL